MSHYRDPLAGLRSQVATKRAVLEAREREVSPVLRALLPERLALAIAGLRPRAQAESETIEGLSDADAALDAVIAAYDEAIVLAPTLRNGPEEVPDPARSHIDPPWLLEEPFLVEIRNVLRMRMLQIDAGAMVSRCGDFAYVSRFRIGLAPCSFVISARGLADDTRIALHESYLRTSLSEALPSLVVRRERIHHVVGKALHLAHEVEVGEPVFDGHFWITGARATTAVLTPQVRAALERLGNRAPVLRLGEGMATLSWTGFWRDDASEVVPDAALDVLVGIRAAVETG